MELNIPKHPCAGKCTAFNEDRCNTCLILAPTCNFCGSDECVFRTQANDGFICIDCIDDLEPVACDITEHLARVAVAQGEIT